jgi:hypothetical protein
MVRIFHTLATTSVGVAALATTSVWGTTAANQCQSTKPPYRTNVGDACTGTGFASTCCAPGEGDKPLFKCGPRHTCCDTGEHGVIDLPTVGEGACVNGKSTSCCSGQCQKMLRPGNHPTFFYSCTSDEASAVNNNNKLLFTLANNHEEKQSFHWVDEHNKCANFELDSGEIPYIQKNCHVYRSGDCASIGYTKYDGSQNGVFPCYLAGISRTLTVHYYLEYEKAEEQLLTKTEIDDILSTVFSDTDADDDTDDDNNALRHGASLNECQPDMTNLLNVARDNSRGKRPDGRCYSHVSDYIDQVGYGGISKNGFDKAIPSAYWSEAHDFADYLNKNGNAARLGLRNLGINNPYHAPSGAIVVVRAGTPGTANPTAGDIAVKGNVDSFWNGGDMGYGGSGNFGPGNTYVLGVFVPTRCS